MARNWILFLLSLFLLSSCYYPKRSDDRHYSVNYNFVMAGDSLMLQRERPLHNQPVSILPDSTMIYRHDNLVVAQIAVIPEDSVDSVWVKVARDQMTMGWTHESELLSKVVPDDPISQFIYIFSHRRLWHFMVAIGALLIFYLLLRMHRGPVHVVLFHDIATCYPTILTIALSGSAILLASIQRFVPQTWIEFYYHPTLNPFGLPLVMSMFLVTVWLIVIFSIASVDEIFRQLRFTDAVVYMFSLFGACMVCYLVFSLTTFYGVSYPLFVAYVVWSLVHYYRHYRPRYLCGNCGSKMHDLGVCTRCGSINK